MTPKHPSSLLRYGIAVVSVALALLMGLVLDPLLRLRLHYLWMILALLVTGHFAGARACLLALSLSLPVLAYFFLPPLFSFAIDEPINEVELLLYALVGLAVAVLRSAMLRGIQRIAETDTVLLTELPAKLATLEEQLVHYVAEGQRQQRLLAIPYKVTILLAKATDLNDTAAAILRTIGESFDWQVGLFWTVDPEAGLLRCGETWQGVDVEAASFVQRCRELTYAKGVGLLGRVWSSERPLYIADIREDAGLPRFSLAVSAGLRESIAIPLHSGDELFGVMEFFSGTVTQPAEDVVQMLTALSGQISQFLLRCQTEKSLREQEHERRMAHTIQQGLLPKRMPSLSGCRIHGKSLPAQDVGGDCFDFISLDSDALALMLADASGHGIGPALLVAETRAYLHALTTTCADVGQILTLTNKRLVGELLEDHFVTLFLGRFERASQSLIYSSAGHCPGYLLDSRGEIKTILASRDPPLGVDRGNTYTASAPISLQPADLLLLYSDGILDARSPTGVPFGAKRMIDLVRGHRHASPENILDALFQDIAAFSGGSNSQDDMTAVLLQVETSLASP